MGSIFSKQIPSSLSSSTRPLPLGPSQPSMAAFSSSLQIPSSSSTEPYDWDVFLSFRGETRNNFVSHLYDAFIQKSIRTFKDESLPQCEEILQKLYETIEKSMVSIVVLSKDYASSSWCLRELVKILKCQQIKRRMVYPVFYHIDPAEVRKQSGSFAKAFRQHEKKFGKNSSSLREWKVALTAVANICGVHITADRNEADCVKEIVKFVYDLVVERVPFFEAKHLVGISLRVQAIGHLLCLDEKDIRIIVMNGMEGIGKTTLATAVFNMFRYQFECNCFLYDVDKTSGLHQGLEELQRRMFKDIYGNEDVRVHYRKGINVIWNIVKDRKILLVLDDVTTKRQLDYLVGRPQDFGLGSRIIITTRERNLLTSEYAAYAFPYNVEGLSYTDALELFSWHAFGKDYPEKEYLEISERIVNYADGHPLALELLGSILFSCPISHWESQLGRPHGQVHGILRQSFDRLNANLKNFLLDIACFFNDVPYSNEPSFIKRLKDCGYNNAAADIRDLEMKSLLYPSEKRFASIMHNLIEKMCQDIAKESKDPPRIIDYCDDAKQALIQNIGTHEVEILRLCFPTCTVLEGINPGVFKQMKRLKFLHLRHATISTSFNYLPEELRVINLERCSLQPLPYNPKNLAFFYMSNCFIERLWIEQKDLGNLKEIEIFGCESLIEMPNLSSANNLESLSIRQCPNLAEIHGSSTGVTLNIAGYLCLSDCPKLEEVLEVSCRGLSKILLEALGIKELSVHGRCSDLEISHCKNLETLPSSIYSMQELCNIYVWNCPKFVGLPRLEAQYSEKCSYISSAADLAMLSFSSETSIHSPKFFSPPCLKLTVLQLCYCNISDFGFLEYLDRNSLKTLDLDGNNLTSIPLSITEFTKLELFSVRDCQSLLEIPKLRSIYKLDVIGSKSLIRIQQVIGNGEPIMQSAFLEPKIENAVDFSALGDSIERVKGVMFGIDLDVKKCRMAITILAELHDGSIISTTPVEFVISTTPTEFPEVGQLVKVNCCSWNETPPSDGGHEAKSMYLFTEFGEVNVRSLLSKKGQIITIYISFARTTACQLPCIVCGGATRGFFSRVYGAQPCFKCWRKNPNYHHNWEIFFKQHEHGCFRFVRKEDVKEGLPPRTLALEDDSGPPNLCLNDSYGSWTLDEHMENVELEERNMEAENVISDASKSNTEAENVISDQQVIQSSDDNEMSPDESQQVISLGPASSDKCIKLNGSTKMKEEPCIRKSRSF